MHVFVDPDIFHLAGATTPTLVAIAPLALEVTHGSVVKTKFIYFTARTTPRTCVAYGLLHARSHLHGNIDNF
jgi:hypothetical protein